MLLLIFKGLLNHLESVEVFHYFCIICLSLLILEPQGLKVDLVVLPHFLEDYSKSILLSSKFLFGTTSYQKYVIWQ
jgi:hypothetical protein